jgi:hypothetical protein
MNMNIDLTERGHAQTSVAGRGQAPVPPHNQHSLIGAPTTRRSTLVHRTVATLALALFGATSLLPATAAVAQTDSNRAMTPSKTPTQAEERNLRDTSIERIVREAKPLRMPEDPVSSGRRHGPPSSGERQGPDGPAVEVKGTLGSDPGAVAATVTTATAAATQNGLWRGAYNSNPNRQIGKLFFDVIPGPGVRWSHCTATVVTASNKSTVVTAGHCVFNPDPDKNGIIEGNGYWYENIRFCPGYEYKCKLGTWTYRRASTTNGWFYGVNHRYNYSDDVAIVLLKRDSAGRYVQNVTGSQGIIFNRSTGLRRHAFGYPAADYRWPEYSYNGQDLVYAVGYDTNDTTIPGTMWMRSTMTGGASGGPWITSPNSSWLGYVNSVNSHKPYGGAFMNGPYFGNAEAQLYIAWRAA